VSITLDSVSIGSTTCTGEGRSGGGGVTLVTGTGAHTLTFSSAGGAEFQSWIAWVIEPPLPASSPQQLEEIADGVVTRDEYLAAFNRFAGCMSGAGYDVRGTTDSVVIAYSLTEDAVSSGADELCYVSQFRDVDIAWQLQNEGSR
jgi:hypothetical protein